MKTPPPSQPDLDATSESPKAMQGGGSSGALRPFRGFRRRLSRAHRTGEAEISTRKRIKKLRSRSRATLAQKLGIIGAILALGCTLIVDIPGLDSSGERMLGIFIAAILLWTTEAVPLYATAVGVIFAQVLLISDQALLPVENGAPAAETFFNSLSNPVIILFMGGFLLADCAAKFKVDRALSAVLLRPFLRNARLTVLGVMLITAVLGMFMSTRQPRPRCSLWLSR